MRFRHAGLAAGRPGFAHGGPVIRLAIRVPAERAEVVLAELLELAPAGVEQVDGDGVVEFALYGAPGELPELPRGPARIGATEVHVSTRELGADWADRWRAFHEPVTVGRLHVRPPWTEPPSEGIDVVIDPAQAFGTGAHATTRLCLELLQELAPAAQRGQSAASGRGKRAPKPPRGRPAAAPLRGPLADLGCGSGVLAIAAAKLGFAPIIAVDHEVAALKATRGNARDNGVTIERVERCDLRREPAPVAPVMTANLVRPLLLRVAQLLPEQPEALIVSGLLAGEEDEVTAAFAPMRERRRRRLQEWSALLLTRP